MSDDNARRVFTADAAFDAVAGLLLLSGTWDGLYRALQLPQGQPALFVQIGGAVLIGFSYLLWQAARQPALRRPVAAAGAIANGLGALIIAAWLLLAGWRPTAPGMVLLAAVAVVLAVFALSQARIARADRPAA